MVLTSGILARDMNLKKVMVKNKQKLVLNNCIFIKGKGDKDIPVYITAWEEWAEHIAQNYKKGDGIHIIAEEIPEIFKSGDNRIDILGCVVKAIVDPQMINTANAFLKMLAQQISPQVKTVAPVEGPII